MAGSSAAAGTLYHSLHPEAGHDPPGRCAAIIGPILQRMASAAGGATGKKDDDASSLSMMMGIQLNTLIDFHVLTEEQLNGILGQINQA